MRVVAAAAALALVSGACRRSQPAPPLVAQVSGSIAIAGLSAPVRVVRDRLGVPHIYAASRDDLFTAQGFVQAQDRLFQMDLWRRSAQGRVSEVLGPNFVERDAMTRRIQFRGDAAAEWDRYGADARAIAAAFVRGINAWVDRARAERPEAFVIAGWKPDFWSPDDLLNRTDAFVASRDRILEEMRRRGSSDVVADAIRRVGAPPFFVGLAAPVWIPTLRLQTDTPYANPVTSGAPDPASLVPSGVSVVHATGDRVEIAEAPRRFETPPRRYLVHLVAPGWNAIGAASPWRPGIAIGHNDRAVWAASQAGDESYELLVEPIDAPTTIIKEPMVVKGRKEPLLVDIERSSDGVVIATDHEHRTRFVLRWSGMGPGGARELRWLQLAQSREDSGLLGAPRQPTRPEVDSATAPALYAHVLAITPAARARFNVGPLRRPSGNDSPLRMVFDRRDWDRSAGVNAPGQSESPDATHNTDFARLWAAGQDAPMPFSEPAVAGAAETTLTLVPAK